MRNAQILLLSVLVNTDEYIRICANRAKIRSRKRKRIDEGLRIIFREDVSEGGGFYRTGYHVKI